MPVEQRERVTAIWLGSTGNGRNPMFNGRRQPSRGGTSRMTRECQVRLRERLGVQFPGPTRQDRTCAVQQTGRGEVPHLYAPQQYLYLIPEPHGQGLLRPTDFVETFVSVVFGAKIFCP